MGLSASQNDINKYANQYLNEVKPDSSTEELGSGPLIWSWLSNWSEEAYKSWAKNPTIDYL